MKTQFTPGPWSNVSASTKHKTVIIGSKVANQIGWAYKEKDARLIAAAPELFETLQWLDRKGGLGLDVHERIAAVLLKAKS